MVRNEAGQADDANVLGTIRPGMKVVDISNRELGVVEFVHQGDAMLPNTGGRPDREMRDGVAMNTPEDEGLFEAIEDVFNPVDDIADDLRSRLSQTGFIRVQSDQLLGQDRYIGADQIHSVSGDFVKVHDSLGGLIRR
jgi:hypothetical protein